MFRMMSVTSSITPCRLVNSCSAPLILMCVTAAPSRRGKQDAAQAVADGGAEAAFERLGDELAVGVGRNLLVADDARGQFQSTPTNSHDDFSFALAELREVTAPTVGGHLYFHLVETARN